MEVVSVFLGVSLILIAGFFFEFIFKRYQIPDVLFLILLGFAIGPFVLKWVDPVNVAGAAPLFVSFALLFLLFDGAFGIDLQSITKGLSTGLGISLINFTASTLAVTIVLVIIGFPFLVSLLMGIVLADISELFVIPVVKRMKVKPETFTILTFESAITDVFCIVGALTVISIINLQTVTFQGILSTIFSLFAVAGLVGIMGGIIWIILVTKLLKEHKSYMMTLAFLLLIYFITEYLNGNGAIAALFFGLIISNSKQLISITRGIESSLKSERDHALEGLLGHSVTTYEERMFYEQVSFFLKVFFFVYIGLLFNLSDVKAIIIGVILTAVTLYSRRSSMLLTKGMDRFSIDLINNIFGKGLGSAAVVIIATQMNVPQTDFLAKVVYVVIFLSILVSSITLYVLKKKQGPEMLTKPAKKSA